MTAEKKLHQSTIKMGNILFAMFTEMWQYMAIRCAGGG